MTYFLIVYDRSKGKVLQFTEFPEEQSAQAMQERFRLELQERSSPEVEVVVIGASSRKALERTHARYFLRESGVSDELLSRVNGHTE